MIWSFGQNKNIPMVNLSTDTRSIIMYACAHTGICYNFENNTQKLLQGHNNNISSTCVSEDKRWLTTADKGPNNCMVIVWDTSTFFPVQTIFEAGTQGVVAMALTPDARYLATISADTPQVLCIWDWTVDGDTALCSATLDPSYGVQNFVLFNPDDTTQIVSNSESQVIFYAWGGGVIEYFCPPLTDDDFNKPVGKYTQSIFLENTNKCLTATSLGNLVVWASNKPLTKAVDNEPTPNKKALKLVKVQDRGINVLMVTDSQIVMGDVNGHVKLFDHNLNLIHWYQDLHIGPINAISFKHIEKWDLERADTQDYPTDCSLVAKSLAMRNFVIGSTQSIYAEITPRGTDIRIILRNHDSAIHGIVTHPTEKKVFIGSYSGLLQIYSYNTRDVVASRKFEKGYLIQCIAIDPKGYFLAVGFTNGVVKILDALNLQDEDTEPFRYSRDCVTHIKFSHDCQYLATADGEFTTTLFKRQHGVDVQPWVYVGRHKAHYKEIQDISFGVELDSDKPRLLTLGKDRNLVEYDLENSCKDNLLLLGIDRIEQSAIPQCITWYPPLNKEHFLLTANDQFKMKLYNVTTKRCRKTVLGPTYGSPLRKICILPAAENTEKRYLAYINEDKIGLHILPLDGNPHNSMALVAHPSGVSNMVASCDGKYLFTSGGADTTVHLWHINFDALEAQSKLGGEDLIPFYGLMEGGRDGELFAELEDYFYYAQLRHQGINTMLKRQVDVKIALSEVPYVMRAMGFYPSEQEVEDMLNEVKFSQYVETGEDVTSIDLGTFIKLYINHRPAFGLSQEKLLWCFEALSGKHGADASIRRGQFLDLLQRKGEHMTEYELSEYLTTLLGFNEEGGSCEQHTFDPAEAGNVIVDNLPLELSAKEFSDDLLGFGFYEPPDVLTLPNSGE
ncbi:cilia- and flagella-associated protein 251-like [Watersipora subatra]|uniref:cilia- and flagella-associated protein 251-like n=1 Tax=Watersipora subatra TaxID=2589382 RepID=UPI00355B5881